MPPGHIPAMESWMSVMALVSVAIVKRRSHLLCLVKFGGLICTKRCVASSHAIDVMHFSKGGGPMGLPVGPSVVDR